jgi:hypothetical protein
MIAGFGVDLSRFAHENPPAPKILYVHAAVFTGWMLLLTAQVLLVLRHRIEWHRKFGWFLAGWACLMAVLGPWAAFASDATSLNSGNGLPPQFLSVNFVDIGGFLVLLAWGIALRKNPAAHKRMMILSTVSLADPGFARFSGFLIPVEPHSVAVVLQRLLRQRPARRPHGSVGLVSRPPHTLIRHRRSWPARSRVSRLCPLLLEALATTHFRMGRSLGKVFRLNGSKRLLTLPFCATTDRFLKANISVAALARRGAAFEN